MRLGIFLGLYLFVATVAAEGGFSLDRLDSLLDRSSEKILEPDQAFKVFAEITSVDRLNVKWEIEEGYYLYHDKFALRAIAESDVLGAYVFPKGTLKQDPAFGEVEVHYHAVATETHLNRPAVFRPLELEITYQGCKEGSVCYPPIKKIFNLEWPSSNTPASSITSSKKTSAQDAITERLLSAGFIVNLLAFFGFGLLLSLTPCIFPMLPILSGLIVGQGCISSRRAFVFSLTFVLAMAFTYALLGLLVASLGLNLQAFFQQGWAIGLFCGVFVLLALSMFGFYELQIPRRVQNKLTAVSDRFEGGLVGAICMGAISALIVGPCVAPPLAGALLYIGQTGDIAMGGLALFFMGLGFGVPLLILGASADRLLPKSGAWMESVKRVFGVLMLAVAIWFLERVLSSNVTAFLWAVLLIVSAIYMGALEKVSLAWSRFSKGVGVVMLVYGIVMLISSATGGGKLTKPIDMTRWLDKTASAKTLPFRYINNESALDVAIKAASHAQKPLMIDFYADWCVVCKELEEKTFIDEDVQQLLTEMVLLKVDVTENSSEDRTLLARFNLYGPPGQVFFSRQGRELRAYKLTGFINAEDFRQHLREIQAL